MPTTPVSRPATPGGQSAEAPDEDRTLPFSTPAVRHERYGTHDALRLGEIELAPLAPTEVLVEVVASSVNPVDWYGVSGFFMVRVGNGLRTPKDPRVGTDVAGRVVARGAEVSDLAVGDEVFGTAHGAWARYAVGDPSKLARKPPGVAFEDAAATPVAALTALQGLRDKASVGSGTKVLVNGASGGVGTYAVQVARWLGAEVTAVCSTANVETARSLGASRVIDYTREDFTAIDERFDVLFDVAGSRPLRELRRVLTREATVLAVGARMSARGLGPLPHLAGIKLAAIGRSTKVVLYIAHTNTTDLELVGSLLADGHLRSVIDRRFEGLDAAQAALDALGAGHARGKLVIAL
ncbi:MAG: NAD(P)-dependent alcohol dehydrogenase [Gaiella sp.]